MGVEMTFSRTMWAAIAAQLGPRPATEKILWHLRFDRTADPVSIPVGERLYTVYCDAAEIVDDRQRFLEGRPRRRTAAVA